jgi:hypothetical protein
MMVRMRALLILSFSLTGEAVSLWVPIPRVLVDPSAPVECRTTGDHVEVCLALVLPVDHPVVAAAFPPPPGTDSQASLTLRDGESFVCCLPSLLVKLILYKMFFHHVHLISSFAVETGNLI